VTLQQISNYSVPKFIHLKNGNISPKELFKMLNKIMCCTIAFIVAVFKVAEQNSFLGGLRANRISIL
jgi:hypothetical protein